ncbi:Thiamin-phosphate pyrophosphorylase [Rhodopirellula islandica]|uniref:Thiamine-phosphate synthase n=1 Tax=Rhodopirellula islandica TaxID=595434 RepID=A0A0J1BGV9_RHOIS|nr:thiamine phosphate synthase [Rhodopirellula islandica]KLU05793.1 Thiamin-phosphate pyrophosphorylase [Rhodopirellula islandica]
MTNAESRTVLRILDANANRAGEGLRTLEESARFILDDLCLTDCLKTHRHDLAVAMGRWNRLQLIDSRDTPGDVGTQVTTASEQSRADLSAVIAAATTRTQQALRCLEEYGKTSDPAFAARIESIRYQCYATFRELELKMAGSNTRSRKLRDARLYALIACEPNADRLEARIAELADAQVDVIQLRDPSVDDRTLFEQARIGAAIAKQREVLWIINDRADIAVAADADGVHVGQEEVPVDALRGVMGRERLIGLSTHDIEQVHAAARTTADYIGCGPTFPGKTKSFDHFPGCVFLKQVSDAEQTGELALPAFAIGGIGLDNVEQVSQAGIGRVAVTGALASHEGLRQTASTMREILERVPFRLTADSEAVGSVLER